MKRILGACAALGMLVLCMAVPGAAQAAFPGANGKIAYEGFPAGGGTDSEIVVYNADGSGATALTSNAVNDIDPAWSPDGKKIAFARFNGSYYEIWTMNADGSGQTVVVQQGKSTTHPAWSPAGNKLLFTLAFSASDDDIYAADSTGLNANLVSVATSGLHERDAAWQPGSGNNVVFQRFNSTNSRYDLVYKTYPSGSVFPLLSSTVTDYSEPAWSPDGTRVAFRNGIGANPDIGRINFNGTGYVGSLPGSSTANDFNPAWSPEGQLLVYENETGSSGTDSDLITHRYDGSLRNFNANPGHDRDPDWQPVTTAQVRPQSTQPLVLPLTIAFDDCGSGPTHDPPFNSSTCGPADASSPDLTVGEPLVNGKPAKGSGTIKIQTVSPSNGAIAVSIKDVRCKNYFSGCNVILGDYTSFVNLNMQFQITDRATAAGTAATIPTVSLSTNVPCTATSDTTVGSSCAVNTDLNTIVPGAVVPGKRASWVLLDASIYDTSSHKFMVPGNFYP